ncbi:MAG TPA: hypothetical protein PLQ00_17115, partial [Thermoguttaceae bacterium]|nr:hypothetical protein [Thermoguttaceae bacterium]
RTRLAALLDALTTEWTPIDPSDHVAIYLLCGAGLVELRFSGWAWTSQSALDFEATACGVWIDAERKSILPEEIRHAVPAWAGQAVAVQLSLPIQARLTAHGETCRRELRDLGPDLLLEYICGNPIRGRVIVRLLGHEAPAPGAVKKDTVMEEIAASLRDIAQSQKQIAAASKQSEAPSASPPETQAASEAEPEFIFRQEGGVWHIRAFGEEGLFPLLRGLQYIADLIKSGSKRITELVASKDASETIPSSKNLAWEDQEGFSALQFRGEGIDREARQNYKRRLQEIDEELQEAKANQDLGWIEKLQEERSRILRELRQKPSDPTRKQLLKKIEKNFATAYRTLEQSMPRTAMHFREAIKRVGELFRYAPSNPPAWNRLGQTSLNLPQNLPQK